MYYQQQSCFIISLSSITYANKAKECLYRQGIRCQVIRTPKHFDGCGCGYSIRVFAQKEVVLSLLQKAKIKIVAVHACEDE